jgi:hypothetical protein
MVSSKLLRLLLTSGMARRFQPWRATTSACIDNNAISGTQQRLLEGDLVARSCASATLAALEPRRGRSIRRRGDGGVGLEL